MESWENETTFDNEVDSLNKDAEGSNSSPTSELNEYLSAIGGSKVNELFATYEQSPNADPYRGLQQLSRKFGDRFSSGDLNLNKATRSFIQRAGLRLAHSSESLNKTFGRTNFTGASLIRSTAQHNEPSAGYISRAGVNEYSSLINQAGTFKGVFFQFQESHITSSLIKKRDSWEVLTQRLDFNNIYGDSEAGRRTTASILAGNELSAEVSSLLRPHSRVRTVGSLGSFHPKTGYTDKYAFIGTQNITSALARKSSMESLLILRRGDFSTRSSHFQDLVAGELIRFTDTAITTAKQAGQSLLRPGALIGNLNKTERGYLYVNNEALPRLAEVLKTAAYTSTNDRVVVSMGELSLLMSKAKGGSGARLVSELKAAMSTLAESGRLSLVTDSGNLNKTLSNNLDIDKEFLLSLVSKGHKTSLRTAVSSFQHEKGVAVFSREGDVKFLSLGSANMSSFAMLPISQQDTTTKQLIKNVFGELSAEESADTVNTEATLMLGTGLYADSTRRQSILAGDYLRDLTQQGKVRQHFTTIAGAEDSYHTGYLAERSASTVGVDKLRAALEEINKKAGADIVEIQQRYAPDISRTLEAVGLRITVKGLDVGSPHRVSVDLTVNKEGNVILSDLNKVISGSLFVNKSRATKNVLGRTLASGQSTKLNAIDTAQSLVATLARSFNYQTRYSLVDSVFERSFSRDFNLESFQSNIRKITTEVFRQELPSLRVLNPTYPGEAPNLSSLIKTVYEQSGAEGVESVGNKVLLRLATGEYSGNPFTQQFTEDQIEQRLDLLHPAFEALNNDLSLSAGMADRTFTKFLLRAIGSDKQGTLNDLKLALIQQDPRAYEAYTSAARSQSRSLLSAITAPFLAAHEQGYSAYQGTTRLPIYGEDIDFVKQYGSGAYSSIAELGLLNPLAMKHGTYIGAAGSTLRAVGAVANGTGLKVPGYGGLRQLNIVDTDLSTGAAVVHDLLLMAQSTSGITLLTQDKLRTEVNRLARIQGLDLNKTEEDELDSLLMQTAYALPFPKLEQIPQRLKNVQGQRPAFEVNNLFARAVRRLDTSLLRSLSPKQYISSRLREVLPTAQFSKVREVYEELSRTGRVVSYEDIQAYFREHEADPLVAQRGFLGGRAMKRVALQAGMSMMGDFSYGNASYKQDLGSVSRMRLKVHQDRLTDVVATQRLLSHVLQPGTVVTTELTPVSDANLANEILNKIGSFGNAQEANARLRQIDSSLADKFLIRMQGGVAQVLMKEGLYTPSAQGYKRVGGFTKDGYIQVGGLNQQATSHLGRRSEPILLKFPAFGKRYQDGASVITTKPSLTISSTGTLIAETDLLTISTATTGSRVVGSGLAKGPVLYTSEQLFNLAESILNKTRSSVSGAEASYKDFIPNALKSDSIYEMRSFSLSKGYNYESGLYLLSQADSRRALLNVSDTEIVRSLGLLFIKDKEIKQGLIKNLRSEGLTSAAAGLAQASGFDVSKTSLGQLATGLASLGGKEALINQDLNKVKELVGLALNKMNSPVGQAASALIGQRTRNLLSQVVSGEDALYLGQTTLLNEGSGLNKGAGLVAHMLFLNRQLFSKGQGKGLSGAMLERKFEDYSAYVSNPSHRMYVDMVASQAGLPLVGLAPDQIIKRLKVLQAVVGSGFTLENIVELGISKSLVPAGMNDEVKMEFQYLLGLSSAYLKPYEKMGGLSDQSISIQSTYSILSAIASGQRIGLPSADSFLEYRLSLLDINATEDSGLLRRNDLHLRRALLAGNTVTEDLLKSVLNNLATKGKGGRELGSLERAAQIITGYSEVDNKLRASELNKRIGLNYIDERRVGTDIAPVSYMSALIAENYEEYRQYASAQKLKSELVPSFGEYIEAGLGSESLTLLNERYRLSDFVLNKIGSGKGTLYEQAKAELLRQNGRHLDRINEAQSTSLADQYLNNMLLAERWLIDSDSPTDKTLLRDVQKSKQLVLPAYELVPLEEGRFRVSFRAPIEVAPSIGVVLGTDILSNAALTFGNYKDDILTKQVELSSLLVENQSLLAKIQRYGSNLTLNEAEAERLNKFRTVVEESRLSVEKLLETDLIRKAFGDHESYKGAVGIAVASFALDPDEFVGGERFHSLIEHDQIGKAIDNQAELVARSGFSESRLEQFVSFAQALQGYSEDSSALETRIRSTMRSSGSVEEIKTLLTSAVYESITGLSPNEVAQKRLTEEGRSQLDKLVAFSLGGGIRRSGAPAGMSGITSESIHYTGMGVAAYNRKLQERSGGESLLRLDESRFKTGMALPALSRLLSGLGDYDGDSYQLLFSRIGEQASSLSKTQEDLLKATHKRGKLQTLIEERVRRQQDGILLRDSYDDELQTKLATTDNELLSLEQSLSEQLSLISQLRQRQDRTQTKAMTDVRQMTQSFLSLPNSLIGKISGQEGLSTGNLISLISQKFSLDGINDAAPYIQQAEQNINLFGKLFDTSQGGFEYEPQALDEQRIDLYTDFLLRQRQSEDRTLLRQQVSDVLDYAKGRVQNASDYSQVMTEYFASSANLAMAFDNVGGSLKKAAGSVLNPFEFEAVQSLIGRGGTELIGKTYNAFIPLLDQVAMESAIGGAFATSDKFKSTMQIALGEDSQLYQKLSSEEFLTKSRQRFFGVTGVLGSMQQLIRDALKAKEGGGLAEVINRKIDTEYGQLTLGEALDRVADDDPLTADRKRVELLKSTLNTTLGPVIKSSVERNPFLNIEDGVADWLRAGQPLDPGVTGFGALIDFAEYTITKPEDLAKKFIEPRGLSERYQEMLGTGKVQSADEFVSGYMLGLIERTQASYLADTFGDNVRGLLVSQAEAYKEHVDTQGRADSLVGYDRMEYDLIKEYQQLKDQGISGVDARLIEEMILLNTRRNNEENKVLTKQHLQDLRDKALGATALRFGIDAEPDSIENRMALGNQMTYNAYIRRMRRGQQLDISEAMFASSFKLGYIDKTLKELGYDTDSFTSSAAKEKALFAAGLNPFTSGTLTPEEQQTLVSGLLRDVDGSSGFEQLRESTAAISKMTGYIDAVNELNQSPGDNQHQLRKLTKQLRDLFDGQKLNVDRMQELGVETQSVPANLIKNVERSLGHLVQEDSVTSTPLNKKPDLLRLKSSVGLETAGALASPLLLALMASDMNVDERIGMFAVDSLQALAQNAADSGRMLTTLTEQSASAAAAFQRQRIRQSIDNEGYLLGSLQGVAQESIFKGLNEVTHQGLNKILGDAASTRTTGQAAVRLGVELMSTILGQGLSRALSKKRVSESGGYTPDLVSRLVSDFIERVWQMAEEVQLSLLNPEYEVTDTEENLRMDFELSAIPSELEWDIETGLVVLDQDNNPVPTEYEAANTENFAMAQSVSAAA